MIFSWGVYRKIIFSCSFKLTIHSRYNSFFAAYLCFQRQTLKTARLTLKPADFCIFYTSFNRELGSGFQSCFLSYCLVLFQNELILRYFESFSCFFWAAAKSPKRLVHEAIWPKNERPYLEHVKNVGPFGKKWDCVNSKAILGLWTFFVKTHCLLFS